MFPHFRVNVCQAHRIRTCPFRRGLAELSNLHHTSYPGGSGRSLLTRDPSAMGKRAPPDCPPSAAWRGRVLTCLPPRYHPGAPQCQARRRAKERGSHPSQRASSGSARLRWQKELPEQGEGLPLSCQASGVSESRDQRGLFPRGGWGVWQQEEHQIPFLSCVTGPGLPQLVHCSWVCSRTPHQAHLPGSQLGRKAPTSDFPGFASRSPWKLALASF